MEGLAKLVQVAVVVENIEEVAERWARLLGVPKPQVIETEEWEKTRMTYRGSPSRGRAKLAFFDLGGVTLELIEPVGGPSTWSEFLEEQGPGIHHIAFVVDDMDGAIRKLEGGGAWWCRGGISRAALTLTWTRGRRWGRSSSC